MKLVFNFKQLLIAIATLALALNLSSCKDQNFDWDTAYANSKQERFTNAFIKEFGQPAEGHQWGFDVANAAFGGSVQRINPSTRTAVLCGTETYYLKMDMVRNHYGSNWQQIFGVPKKISDRENAEVYAWFSNHKVIWEYTPAYYDYQKDEIVMGVKNSDGTWKYSDDAHIETTTKPQSVSKNTYNTDTYAHALAQTGGQFGSAIVAYEIDSSHPGYGSLVDNSSPYFYATANAHALTSKYVDGNEFKFINGWIQHVANDNVKYDELGDNGSTYNAANMDYLNFKTLHSTEITADNGSKINATIWAHLNDFNSCSGYGHGNQIDGNSAGLVVDIDFNEFLYKSSASSSNHHNKYYVVYLKGGYEKDSEYGGADTRYEGWYLGMDMEAFDNVKVNGNERVPANGICNDWILKITQAGNSAFAVARIMCEDLGDPTNINSGTEISDIDYNDLVLDVEPINNNIDKIKLTLEAAGGTLPLTVWYCDTPLFETHELYNGTSGYVYADNDRSAAYETMYNTGELATGSTATASEKSVYLNFDGTRISSTLTSRSDKTFNFTGTFVLSNIKVKVWRLGSEDYKTNNISGIVSDGEWVELANVDGEAPIMICVPKYNSNDQEVLWCRERVNIGTGYGMATSSKTRFKNWVEDFTQSFWEPDVPSSNGYLYNH